MGETTLYLVAYDVGDDKRRTRVHRVLCGYGQWTQYSLFECHLTRLQYIELQSRLAPLINADTDSLRLYPLCQACVKRVETIGGRPPQEPQIFLL